MDVLYDRQRNAGKNLSQDTTKPDIVAPKNSFNHWDIF